MYIVYFNDRSHLHNFQDPVVEPMLEYMKTNMNSFAEASFATVFAR